MPALVLCPSRTIQRQWAEKQALFGPASEALHALTYQSVCQTSDPEGMLREAAERMWAAERAGITGQPVAEVVAESARWEGAAAARRDRDVARLVAAMKRRVAAGKLPDLPAGELLSRRRGAGRRAARRRRARRRARRVPSPASLWGALLKAVLDLLEPEHVLGLTATNPLDVTAEQAALYAELLDSEDFSVPTPAVVREGFLRPTRSSSSSASRCNPSRSARRPPCALRARARRAGSRACRRGASRARRVAVVAAVGAGGGRGRGAVVVELARRQPRLADAGLRWLHARGIAAPADAPRGEQHRAALTIDDWVVLLDDYTLRCLRGDPSDEAARRLDALQVALGDLGFALTRQGIRRVGGEVDRVLLSSASKPLAMCDVLACEYDARGPALRRSSCATQSARRASPRTRR